VNDDIDGIDPDELLQDAALWCRAIRTRPTAKALARSLKVSQNRSRIALKLLAGKTLAELDELARRALVRLAADGAHPLRTAR
jgi:hypothetical protein